jgi:protein-tyrosine phosphatase
MDNVEKLRPFIDMGCLAQVTAASMIGGFGVAAQACAAALLERRWVSVIASDAHNLLHRAPVMTAARDWLTSNCGHELADELTLAMPAKILGVDLPGLIK